MSSRRYTKDFKMNIISMVKEQGLKQAEVARTMGLHVNEFIYSELNNHSVVKLAKVMNVSRSGYYAWLKRDISNTGMKRNEIKREIMTIYIDSNRIYGAPKITKELHKRGYQKNCIKEAIK